MIALTSCPTCNTGPVRRRFSCPEPRGTTVAIDECPSCGLGFVNPQPNWDELAPWYSETYNPYDTEHGFEASDEIELKAARASGTIRHVPFRPGCRLLDVGCGGGSFLRRATALGIDAFGVEPSTIAAERARSQGHRVFTGTIEEFAASYAGPPFDVVCSSVRAWLRRRLMIPRRLSDKLGFIDTAVAPALARRLDAKGVGEALIGRFGVAAPASAR